MGVQLPLKRLQQILTSWGLPSLRGVTFIDERGPLELHRLCFEEGQRDLVLARCLWPTGTNPFIQMFAAHRVLSGEDIHYVDGFKLFPARALPTPAAIWVDNQAKSPTASSVTCEQALKDLGRIWSRLLEVVVPRPGIRADMGDFTTVRGDWSKDLAYVAERETIGLWNAGWGGCRMVSALNERVQEGLPAITEPEDPVLVHFGLQPNRLQYVGVGETASLVGAIGWEHAIAGDPLAGLAPLIYHLNGHELAVVLEHMPPGSVPALQRDALKGLEVYVALVALIDLCSAASATRHRPGKVADRTFAQVQEKVSRCLEPDFVERSVNSRPVVDSVAPASSLDSVALLEHRALMAMGSSLPESDRVSYLIAVFSSVALARAVSSDVCNHFVDQGHLFLGAANLDSAPLRAVGPADVEAWRREMIDQARNSQGALSVSLLAEGLQGLDASRAVPPRCLTGMEAWFRGQQRRETLCPHLPAPQRALHGLLGQDAWLRLGDAARADQWKEVVVGAFEVLQLGESSSGERPAKMVEILPIFARRTVFRREGILAYPALAASLRLEQAGALAIPPGQVVQLCKTFMQSV